MFTWVYLLKMGFDSYVSHNQRANLMTLHDSYPTYIPCLPRSPLQEADTEKGINLDGKSKTFGVPNVDQGGYGDFAGD